MFDSLCAEMVWPADKTIVIKLCSFVLLFAILRVEDNLLLKVRLLRSMAVSTTIWITKMFHE